MAGLSWPCPAMDGPGWLWPALCYIFLGLLFKTCLGLLVNVHIVGGDKDLALHLKGLTLRVHVIQDLIDILRHSG